MSWKLHFVREKDLHFICHQSRGILILYSSFIYPFQSWMWWSPAESTKMRIQRCVQNFVMFLILDDLLISPSFSDHPNAIIWEIWGGPVQFHKP